MMILITSPYTHPLIQYVVVAVCIKGGLESHSWNWVSPFDLLISFITVIITVFGPVTIIFM